MADFSFETEFEDSVTRSANQAAAAMRKLERGLDTLSKSEQDAARQALKMARAHDAVASAADRARRSEEKLHRSNLSGVGVARAQLAADTRRFRMAKAQAALAQSQVRKASGTGLGGFSGGLPAIVGGAAAVAGWMKVIDVTVGTIGAGVEKAFDFTMAVKQAAQFSENMRFSFRALTGGEASGAKAFETVNQLALDLGENVEATGDRMRRLLAQKFTLGQSEGLLKMLADLRLVGIEGEKADRVLMALTQIKAKGRLQAEEMLQLAEAGVSIETVYGQLGKKLGKTRAELEKMQKAGKITSQDALDAVQGAALELVGENEAGAAGKRFAQETLTGIENTWNSAKSISLSKIGEDALPVFKKLGPIVSDMAQSLTDDGLRGKLAKSFGVLGDLIDSQGGQFGDDFANGLNVAADAFDRIVKLGSAFTEGFMDGFRPFLDTLGNDGVASVDGLTNSTQIFGVVAGDALGSILGNLNSLVETLDMVGSKVDWVRNLFGGDDKNMTTTGQMIGDSFAAGLKGSMLQAIPGVGQVAALLGSAMVDGTRGTGGIDAHSPSRKAEKAARDYSKGLEVGADGNLAVKAGARLGASFGAGASIAARQGGFVGSPAHRAMSNTTNNSRSSNVVNATANYSFNGMSQGEANATVKGSFFDIAAVARASFELG